VQPLGPAGTTFNTNLRWILFMSSRSPSSSSSSSSESAKSQPVRKHDPGAYAAWSLILGAALGAGIGALFHATLLAALVLGTIGWLVGALVDRSRH